MDFSFSAEDEAYRAQAQAWLSDHIPDWWRAIKQRESEDRAAYYDELKLWHRELYAAGYVGVTWPKAYGGHGVSPVRNALLQAELVRADAPPTLNALGINLCGPAIIHHGSETQKKRFLAPMLRAEEIWCQGYSEPGAGSDLASLKTRAVLRGDTYIVNGQKVWTSNAHLSDWNFCLVRTNPDVPKHSGIGFLLINMRTPGVEVRPIRQINGASGFSEVFYTDVEVPAENMVGAPDEGWRVANTLLGYERGSGTLTRSLNFARQLRELFALAKTQKRGGKALYDDPAWRQRLGQFAIDVEVLRLFGLRQLTTLARGEAHGPESSIQKLYWSELEQRLAIAGNEMLGPYAQLTHHSEAAVDEGRWSHRELTTRAVTIYSGTSEIQKNIIAERVLGLPRG